MTEANGVDEKPPSFPAFVGTERGSLSPNPGQSSMTGVMPDETAQDAQIRMLQTHVRLLEEKFDMGMQEILGLKELCIRMDERAKRNESERDDATNRMSSINEKIRGLDRKIAEADGANKLWTRAITVVLTLATIIIAVVGLILK